jgi:hypothetical protein
VARIVPFDISRLALSGGHTHELETLQALKAQLSGRDPVPLAPNIACLDYSVAQLGGKLVAYRWDGE